MSVGEFRQFVKDARLLERCMTENDIARVFISVVYERGFLDNFSQSPSQHTASNSSTPATMQPESCPTEVKRLPSTETTSTEAMQREHELSYREFLELIAACSCYGVRFPYGKISKVATNLCAT